MMMAKVSYRNFVMMKIRLRCHDIVEMISPQSLGTDYLYDSHMTCFNSKNGSASVAREIGDWEAKYYPNFNLFSIRVVCTCYVKIKIDTECLRCQVHEQQNISFDVWWQRLMFRAKFNNWQHRNVICRSKGNMVTARSTSVQLNFSEDLLTVQRRHQPIGVSTQLNWTIASNQNAIELQSKKSKIVFIF